MNYTPAELMVYVLSQEIRDGETVAVGTLSPIPAAAVWLAQQTHAPAAQDLILGDPDWPFESSKEFFDFIQRGALDVFFLSGAQIDRRGNINLHVIGDYEAPKVRLPGGAGSAMVYFMAGRTLLFKTSHDRQTFVEKVDFITSAGTSEPNVHRPGRVGGVFTPMAILRPRPDGLLTLGAVMPGVTPAQVQEQTGFDLAINGEIPEVKPPHEDVLRVLRGPVRDKLREFYPKFAAEAILPAD